MFVGGNYFYYLFLQTFQDVNKSPVNIIRIIHGPTFVENNKNKSSVKGLSNLVMFNYMFIYEFLYYSRSNKEKIIRFFCIQCLDTTFCP